MTFLVNRATSNNTYGVRRGSKITQYLKYVVKPRSMLIYQKQENLFKQLSPWYSFMKQAIFFNFIEVKLIYKLLISAVQKSDSVIHAYTLFIFFFHYGLSQDIEYSSLCYTVGPCCLSILYIIVEATHFFKFFCDHASVIYDRLVCSR